jgi:hypothetical protein
LLATFFKDNVKVSINEFVLSFIAVMLLPIAPYFMFKLKPSKYFVSSLIFSAVTYITIVILLIYHSNLPNYFEEIGVLIFGIFIFFGRHIFNNSSYI